VTGCSQHELSVYNETIFTLHSSLINHICTSEQQQQQPDDEEEDQLNGQALSYLTNLTGSQAFGSTLELRSVSYNKLVMRRSRLSTAGDRAFSVAAPRLWNSLPACATSAKTLSTFKKHLKTQLFNQSYKSLEITK